MGVMSHSPLPPRFLLRGPRRASSAVWGLATILGLLLLAARPAAADLDVVFALDTTGSMGGEIQEVQDRVRQLAVSISAARPGERIRYGIVAYRDRGDEYVTKTLPLTADVATAGTFLDELVATGGGDGPEAVVAALAAALREMPWDLSDAVDRQIFLVGDAPPHLDYDDDPEPEQLLAEARRDRIVIHAIGCRSLPASGVDFFRQVAYATEGSYQHIGRVRAAEPGALTRALDETARASSRGAERGEPVPLEWRLHDDLVADAILARFGRGEWSQGEPGSQPACVLEVLLPPGVTLEGSPGVRLSPRGLEVTLPVGDGDGGRDVFDLALSPCPPLVTPVHVALGGR